VLARSDSPTRLRWLLWTAKEAAFKAVKQADPALVFSPRRFVVAWAGGAAARVAVGDRRLDVTLDLRPDCVHAIATHEEAPRVSRIASAPRSARTGRLVWGVEATSLGSGASPELASRRARELAVETVARALGVAASRLAIVREGRLPRLLDRGRALAASLSLSHHGRFVAFACLLDEPGAVGRSPR
jgi:phosphopantetheinyl transferase